MGTSKECILFSSRLKREDCNHPKHDSLFSEWKDLIGPSDWEDHSLGKDGAEKYKVHNLPNCPSCPGLYELGIVVPSAHSGRKAGKLDPDHIIPVYLGQTDNVRTRLQRYGSEGAHLENGNPTGQLNDCVQKGRGLFLETFSRGYSIVYRWAPMENKRDAEKAETRLLDKFDYAWNKGNNGVRRHCEIFHKLDRSTSGSTRLLAMARKLPAFHQKEIGVKIDPCKPLSLENGSSIYTNWENNDLLPRILKIGTSQPRPVSLRFGINEDHTSVCGVALCHGAVCKRPPVGGRKRCDEHKGMKINGFTSKKLMTEGKPLVDYLLKPQLRADSSPVSQESLSICGVTLDDGNLCRQPPVEGRKRCEAHNGRRITGSPISESVTEGKQQHYVHGPVLKLHKSHGPQSPVFSESPAISTKMDTICGVDFDDGTFCMRRPVVGRKRCEEHKGMRTNVSKSSIAEIPSLFEIPKIPSLFENSGIGSSTCGATVAAGSSCRRPPAEGGKRCWQHKGMGARCEEHKGMRTNESKSSIPEIPSLLENSGIGSSTCGATVADGSSCRRPPAEGGKRCWQHKGMGDRCEEHKGMRTNVSKPSIAEIPSLFENSGIGSSTCGATVADGSSCRRPPAEGGKRCWQHKGMRANTGSAYSITSMYDSRGISSDICGAALRNGSICYRTPVCGRKRCEQHKGMRAAY